MSVLSAHRAPSRPDDARLRHARRMLLVLYGITGIAVAGWLSRLPTIRTELDLSAGQLGTLLLVGSIGSLAMVLVAGALTTRWGSGRALMTAAVMFAVGNALVGLGPAIGSVPVFAVGILIASSSYALANVPLNLESVVIQAHMERTVVPQFHAAFSVGSVIGALIGAAISWASIPVAVHFIGLSVATLVVRAIAISGAVLPIDSVAPSAVAASAAAPTSGLRASLAAWREPRTLLIGVIVMSAALSEGSANNWLTIAVVDGFDRTEALAAIVFGLFVGSMTTARLIGSRLIDRHGPVAVLAASGATSLVGLLLFAFAPVLPLAALGVIGWGLGAGLVVPIGMAAVSGDRIRTAGRVAVLSAFASFAAIVAPPALGFAADVVGVRHALLFVGIGLVASIVLARTVRRDAEQAALAASTAPSASTGTGGVEGSAGEERVDRPPDLLSVQRGCGAPARRARAAVGTC